MRSGDRDIKHRSFGTNVDNDGTCASTGSDHVAGCRFRNVVLLRRMGCRRRTAGGVLGRLTAANSSAAEDLAVAAARKQYAGADSAQCETRLAAFDSY